MKTKYVTGEVRTGLDYATALVALVFPESIIHKSIAQRNMTSVRSAGFFRVVDGKVETYGESDSLNMGPAENDEILIARAIGLHPDCY